MKTIDLDDYYFRTTQACYTALQGGTPMMDVSSRVMCLLIGALRLQVSGKHPHEQWRDIHLRLDGYSNALLDMYCLPSLTPNVKGSTK